MAAARLDYTAPLNELFSYLNKGLPLTPDDYKRFRLWAEELLILNDFVNKMDQTTDLNRLEDLKLRCILKIYRFSNLIRDMFTGYDKNMDGVVRVAEADRSIMTASHQQYLMGLLGQADWQKNQYTVNKNNQCYEAGLPQEMWELIFSNLSFSQRMKLAQTNRSLKLFVESLPIEEPFLIIKNLAFATIKWDGSQLTPGHRNSYLNFMQKVTKPEALTKMKNYLTQAFNLPHVWDAIKNSKSGKAAIISLIAANMVLLTHITFVVILPLAFYHGITAAILLAGLVTPASLILLSIIAAGLMVFAASMIYTAYQYGCEADKMKAARCAIGFFERPMAEAKKNSNNESQVVVEEVTEDLENQLLIPQI